MPSTRRALRPFALTSVLALVLALLWSLGWGQVHRVLHPGVQLLSVADASGKAAVPDLGDEDGSGLCKLLDHLTHGAGPVALAVLLLNGEPPAATPATPTQRASAASAHSFDARGPPQPT